MKFRSTFFWIFIFWVHNLAAQIHSDENDFNYHKYFCKGDSLPNLKKLEKLFKHSGKDAKILWAMRLSHAGLISYNDTFTRQLQYTANLLQAGYPAFKIKIGTIKSPGSGFISVSKDLIFIYAGTYACLQSDEQLNALLMLAVINHQHAYNNTNPKVQINGNRWVLYNEISETDNREASLLLHKIYSNAGYGIPSLQSNNKQDLSNAIWLKNIPVNSGEQLCSLAKLTTLALEFQDGNYDKIIQQLSVSTWPHNHYTSHLLLKCFYMKTLEMIQHPYFPKEQFNFFTAVPEPIADKNYFHQLLNWMQQAVLNLNSDLARAILFQTISLEKELAELPQYKANYSFTATDKIFEQKLYQDSGWAPFLKKITNEPWYQSTEKIYKDSIPSAKFLELLPDPRSLKKENVLLISGEPMLMDTFSESIRTRQWYLKEKYAEFQIQRKIQKCTERLIRKSHYPKAFQNDYKLLKHGDICRHTNEINNAGLQLPFVSWLTRDSDPEFNSNNLRYIIYIQTSLLPGTRMSLLKQYLIRMGLPIPMVYNKFLSGLDVYDIHSHKYIYTSRRLIDYHGLDVYISNLYDQLLPLIK